MPPEAEGNPISETPAAPLPDAQTEPSVEEEGKTSAESATAQGENETEGEQPKPTQKLQQRFDEITRARRSAERERDAALDRERALQSRMQSLEAPKPNLKEPVLEDFANDPDPYLSLTKATAKFEAEKRWTELEKEREQKAAAERQQTERQEVAKSWNQQVAPLIEEHPDFPDAIEALDDMKLHGALMTVMAKSDGGAKLAYHLGTHPKEAAALAKLDPAIGVFELGKLQARLAAETAKPTKSDDASPLTKAPAPPSPVRSGSKPTPDIYDPNLSFKDYVRMRDAQQKRK